VKDMDWALICAMKGADNAVNPGPFYATIVDIKSLGRITDTDTVAMLEYLAEHFPREVYWAEWLGDIYFQKDDIRRSLNVFAPIIGDDLKNIGIRSILVASETARLNGECYKAIDILTRAYTNHPEAPEILNNLIYCLAQSGDQKNVAKAKYLLPKLAMFNQKSAAMFDTAAFVYLKDGDLIAARKYMDEALRLIDENDYSTTQIKLNAAEIMFGLGKYGESSSLLKNIRKRKDVSGAVQHGVLDLTTKINELQGEKR